MSKEANARYDAKSTRHYGFKFNIKTDADIIEALEASPNKQALVKQALRAYAIPASWTGAWPDSPRCPSCRGEVDDEIVYMLDGRELPNYCPYCGKNLTGTERKEKRTVKNYKVKTEYLDSWLAHGDSADEVIVDEDEINRLAHEWGVTVDELMEQVEEI